MDERCRVVIVEDHAIVREGLRSLLTSTKEFDIVGEAEDGHEAINLIDKSRPDLVLTDLSMPRMNGMEMIRTVKKRSSETKVIALTVHRGEEHILAAFKAGADGYVVKEATYSELMMAIKSVLKGNRYVSPEISGRLIDGYLEGSNNRVRSVMDILTPRERQVLKLIAEGYRHKEIADLLYISRYTVEKHRANIMAKLDLHSTVELVTLAIEEGLACRR